MPADPPKEALRLEQVVTLPLEPAVRRRAQELVSRGPDARGWLESLDRLALVSGAVLVVSGVVCFFAFNWRALHRFGKFGLIAAVLLAAVAFAWKVGAERPSGKAALGVACGLVGVWLAVIGQTYQTGADAFELFRAWSLLILPWVLLARSQGLWAFWVVILNFWLFLGFEPNGLGMEESLFWACAALNGGAWLVREGLQERLRGRWLARVLVLPALGAPLELSVGWILRGGAGVRPAPWALAATVALAGALVALFRHWRRDLFMVTLGLGAGITLVTTLLGHALLARAGFGCDALLIVGLALVVQVGGAAAWLRALGREVA